MAGRSDNAFTGHLNGKPPVEQLTVQIVHRPERVAVALQGDGSNMYAQTVRGYFEAIAASRPGRVEIDLSALTFINSIMVGVLVEFRGQLANVGGTLLLHDATGPVLEVLKACRVADLLR